MRQNNTGMKIALVVLVVVCIFQGMSLTSITTEMDELRNEVNIMGHALNDVKYQLTELLNSQKQEEVDVTWGIEEVDWQNRICTISYVVKVPNATDLTRVVIDSGMKTLELDRENMVFSGRIELPIDNKEYQTKLYLYEGDHEENCQYIDTMGMQYFAAKFFMCDFYGYSSYGNNRLTLAGNFSYDINVEEKVTSMKLVCGSQEQSLSTNTNEEAVNVSIPINTTNSQSGTEIKEVYFEIATENGTIFKVYPDLYKMYSYEMGMDEESEMISVGQEGWLMVILPDGTTYGLHIYY